MTLTLNRLGSRRMSDQLGARVQEACARAHTTSSDFDLNPDVILPENRKLRDAGVLIPVIWQNGQHWVILTKRSSALKHHPGQIAFPGGKRDDGDTDVVATALREAQEEIGLKQSNVSVLGQLPPHETVTQFSVTPVIGLVKTEFEAVPEKGEVEDVFRVPLDFVLAKQNFRVQSRRWQGRQRAYFTIPFGPYYIWGATARMLCAWADAMT